MTTCLVIAALITCTGLPPRPTPAEAVKVLTSSVQPYVAPWPRPRRDLQPARPDPNWPFKAPATPILPLASPWSVTTIYGRHGVETFFNGKSFTRPGVELKHRSDLNDGDHAGRRSPRH